MQPAGCYNGRLFTLPQGVSFQGRYSNVCCYIRDSWLFESHGVTLSVQIRAVPLSLARWASLSPAVRSGWEEGRSAYLWLWSTNPTTMTQIRCSRVLVSLAADNIIAGWQHAVNSFAWKRQGEQIFTVCKLCKYSHVGVCIPFVLWRLKESQLIWKEKQRDKYACRGLFCECIYGGVSALMWLCLGPRRQREGSTEGKVERRSVPDTVIVVTAGVMPASL